MTETDRLTLPIVELAKNNENYREVLWTGKQSQVVLMAIPEGEEIGNEVHEGHDQLLWFVEGSGLAKIGEREMAVQAGDLSIVPGGVYHNFKNTGSGMLKLFTTYSPPEHDPGTEQSEKPD